VIAPDLVLGGDLPAQTAAVRELLTHLGVERFAAIGHSHGGGIAQLLALDGPPADALVLIDTVAFDVAPPADLDPRTLLERGTVEFALLPEVDLDAYLAAPPRSAPHLAGALVGRDDDLARVDVPVLMLWGEDDPFVPLPVAERLNEAIPASTLGVVPECGHFLLDDAFDSVGVLVAEYLRARYLGAPHGHDGIVMLQLERRPPWVDPTLFERDHEHDQRQPHAEDDDDVAGTPDPAEQEVGPNA
ncbi:MAG: alpha/beta fold hydrolase, partial [Actinomycetota bacterium]